MRCISPFLRVCVCAAVRGGLPVVVAVVLPRRLHLHLRPHLQHRLPGQHAAQVRATAVVAAAGSGGRGSNCGGGGGGSGRQRTGSARGLTLRLLLPLRPACRARLPNAPPPPPPQADRLHPDCAVPVLHGAGGVVPLPGHGHDRLPFLLPLHLRHLQRRQERECARCLLVVVPGAAAAPWQRGRQARSGAGSSVQQRGAHGEPCRCRSRELKSATPPVVCAGLRCGGLTRRVLSWRRSTLMRRRRSCAAWAGSAPRGRPSPTRCFCACPLSPPLQLPVPIIFRSPAFAAAAVK